MCSGILQLQISRLTTILMNFSCIKFSPNRFPSISNFGFDHFHLLLNHTHFYQKKFFALWAISYLSMDNIIIQCRKSDYIHKNSIT